MDSRWLMVSNTAGLVSNRAWLSMLLLLVFHSFSALAWIFTWYIAKSLKFLSVIKLIKYFNLGNCQVKSRPSTLGSFTARAFQSKERQVACFENSLSNIRLVPDCTGSVQQYYPHDSWSHGGCVWRHSVTAYKFFWRGFSSSVQVFFTHRTQHANHLTGRDWNSQGFFFIISFSFFVVVRLNNY